MKKTNILFIAIIAFITNDMYAQNILPDNEKKPGVVYVENGEQQTASGRMYRAGVGIDFATRSFNGNSNDRFGNIGD